MPPAPALFLFDDVKPLVGATFSLRASDGSELSLVLSEADSLGFNRPQERGGRESFSLVFHAPPRAAVRQGTYELSHPQLGCHVLFVVPLGPDSRGMRLQAIFNFS